MLWDIFPEGGRLGGAPTNFACHCRQLGGDAYPVSCVGDDDLGRQARVELERLAVSADFVQQSTTHPTGRVLVSLDAGGKPGFEILDDMAWDYLQFTPDLRELAGTLDAICFGVLAQRASRSRDTIRTVLRTMPERSLKIFDVNLREGFFSKPLIEASLQLASVLKLSDEELPVLAGYFDLAGGVTDQLARLRERFGLDLIAYTRGRDGSLLMAADAINETAGLEVRAVDTVGAGDSFTAALCMGLLNGMSFAGINALANKVAAFVCSQKGATPSLPADLLRERVAS